MTRTTTQERSRSTSIGLNVSANTVDNDALCVAPCSSHESPKISDGSAGSGQSLYSAFWGEQSDRVDGDTCLGVGVSMNDELSPFMTTTFPTVELCFHSGALYLNSSQNRAIYSLNARRHNEPSVVRRDPESGGSHRPCLSPTETVTPRTCLPSSV